MSERLTIEDLKNIYGVTERTLNTWKKTKSLPLLQISSQHKYIYKDDLMKWEKSFIHS
jgi:hypothetical protein